MNKDEEKKLKSEKAWKKKLELDKCFAEGLDAAEAVGVDAA